MNETVIFKIKKTVKTGLYSDKAFAILRNIFDELASGRSVYEALISRAADGEITIQFTDSDYPYQKTCDDKSESEFILENISEDVSGLLDHYPYADKKGTRRLKISKDKRFGYLDYVCVGRLLGGDFLKLKLMKYDQEFVDEMRGIPYDPIRTEMETKRRVEIDGLVKERVDKITKFKNIRIK